MGELREIVNLEAVGRGFALLAVVLPLLGLAVGAVWGARRGQARQGAVTGVFIGALGTLNWLLWLAYNAITARLGLDTVRNVVVNLGFFVFVGLALGVGVGMAQRRIQPVQPMHSEAEPLQEQAERIQEQTTGQAQETVEEIL